MLKPKKVKISVKDVKFVDYLKSRPYSNHVTNLWCLTSLVQREFNTNFVIEAVIEDNIFSDDYDKVKISLYEAYACYNRLYFVLNCNPYEDTVEDVLKDIYKILMNGDKLKEGDNIFEKYANLEIDIFEPIKILGFIPWSKIPDTNYDMFYKYFNEWVKEEDSRVTRFKYLE